MLKHFLMGTVAAASFLFGGMVSNVSQASSVTAEEMNGTKGTQITNRYFTDTSNGISATYMLGSFNSSGAAPGLATAADIGELGGINSFPRKSIVLNEATGKQDLTVESNVMNESNYLNPNSWGNNTNPLPYNMNSKLIDVPNIVINKSNGQNIGSLFNDSQTLKTGTTRNIYKLLKWSTAMGVSAANQIDIASILGTPDNNLVTFPDYINVKSYDVDQANGKIETKFESYYSGKTETGVGANSIVQVGVDLTMTSLPDGSVKVDEKFTNDSGTDLKNVYLTRQNNTFLGDLTKSQNTGSGPDSVKFSFMGHNQGLYLDGDSASTTGTNDAAGLKINYQFNVENGPDAWIATYDGNNTQQNNSTISSVFGKNADGNKTGTALGNTGDYHPDASAADLTTGAYSYGKVSPNSNQVVNGSVVTGVSMKWGAYDTWKSGETIDTSYVYGIGSSKAPMITLTNPEPGTDTKNTGKDIDLTGTLIDADVNGGNEKLYYSVDDGTTKSLGTMTGVLSQTVTDFPSKLTIPADELSNDSDHTVTIWAVDDSGQKSNIQAFNVVKNEDLVKTTTELVNPAKMYWSQQIGSGNADIYNGYFNPGQIGGWDTFLNKNTNHAFSLKLTDGQIFPALNTISGKSMFMAVSDNSTTAADKDDLSHYSSYQSATTANGVFHGFGISDTNRPYAYIDNGPDDSNYNDGAGPASGVFPTGTYANDEWGYVKSDYVNKLDPQVKHYFKLGQNIFTSGNNLSGVNYTENSIPFILTAPAVTVNTSKTYVASDQNTINPSQINGTSQQTGDDVFAIADANGDGQFDKDDEANSKTVQDAREDGNDSDLALTKQDSTSTVNSSGNYQLSFKDTAWNNKQMQIGKTIWVIETNGSGGTSGMIASSAGEGWTTTYDRVTKPTPVTVSSAYSLNYAPTNWDFGKHDQPGTYDLEKVTDDSGNTQNNQLDLVVDLKQWQVSAKLEKFSTADGSKQLDNAVIKLDDINLTDDSGNTYDNTGSEVASQVALPSGAADSTDLVKMNYDANKTANEGSLHLKLGNQNADTKIVVPTLPEDGNSDDYENYQATINWQLTNSIS